MTIYAVEIGHADTPRLIAVEAKPRGAKTLAVPRISAFRYSAVIPIADAKTSAADAIWCASSLQQQKIKALREQLVLEEEIQATIERLNPAEPTVWRADL